MMGQESVPRYFSRAAGYTVGGVITRKANVQNLNCFCALSCAFNAEPVLPNAPRQLFGVRLSGLSQTVKFANAAVRVPSFVRLLHAK